MSKVQRFEELLAWQKARALTRAIYEATRTPDFSRDFGLANQIQRAAVSVMSNIAEGFERGSQPEFARFLSIAKASCAEVRSQLYIALDIGYLSQTEFNDLMAQAEEVARIVSGLRASVERQIGKPRHGLSANDL
ncbi:MAG: four helix bundle protein [bacterium]|nr:four helix bundle protein [bacterium]